MARAIDAATEVALDTHGTFNTVEMATVAFDAMIDAVPNLVWDIETNCEYIKKATTSFGTYFICDDRDDFTGLYMDFVTHKNAQWFSHVTAHSIELASGVHEDTTDTLEAAANKHHRAQVRAIWEQGK